MLSILTSIDMSVQSRSSGTGVKSTGKISPDELDKDGTDLDSQADALFKVMEKRFKLPSQGGVTAE